MQPVQVEMRNAQQESAAQAMLSARLSQLLHSDQPTAGINALCLAGCFQILAFGSVFHQAADTETETEAAAVGPWGGKDKLLARIVRSIKNAAMSTPVSPASSVDTTTSLSQQEQQPSPPPPAFHIQLHTQPGGLASHIEGDKEESTFTANSPCSPLSCYIDTPALTAASPSTIQVLLPTQEADADVPEAVRVLLVSDRSYDE